MRVFSTIMKIVASAAAIVGAVDVAATYGDQIVAWAKKTLSSLSNCPCCKREAPAVEEAPVEEAPVEEAPVEESPAEEAPTEEAPDAVESVPEADDSDCEG